MRLFLIAVALLAALWVSPALADAPAGFTRATALEPAASWVAGKPVTVYCGITRVAEAYESGYAYAGSSEIFLSVGLICGPLKRQLAHQHPMSFDFGSALLILVHESVHARGVVDESITDCTALRQMSEVGIRFFGLRGQRRYLRDMTRAAWSQHRAAPDAYTRTC